MEKNGVKVHFKAEIFQKLCYKFAKEKRYDDGWYCQEGFVNDSYDMNRRWYYFSYFQEPFIKVHLRTQIPKSNQLIDSIFRTMKSQQIHFIEFYVVS